MNKPLSALCIAATLIGGAADAATLDLAFNYRLTPAAGAGQTVATAHFEDVIDSNGLPAVDLRLTNVASNLVPGVGATSYISGLLLAFDYTAPELPGIVVEQFGDDSAQSDRWEPQEDVATVDGFTFTSELGFPRSETPSSVGARLAVGEVGHIQFQNDGSLPNALTVDKLVAAIRGGGADAGAPTVLAAVKVRSLPNLTGGETIESVPTVVIAAGVPSVNHAPTADAGADASVDTGATVQLDGSASSDPDSDAIAAYQWTQLSGETVMLSSATAQRPSFTAPATAGTLVFALAVSDGSLQSDPDTVTITVNAGNNNPPPSNRAPSVDAGADQSVAEAGLVTLAGSASDADGDGLSYQWEQTGGTAVSLHNPQSATASFTAPWLASGSETLSFKLTVTDDAASPASAEATVDVVVNNDDGLLDCSQARPSKTYLWSPNGAMQKVLIQGITGPGIDTAKPNYDLRIDAVSQDEPLKNPALKDKTSPDAKITRTKRSAKKPLALDILQLRAERQGQQPKNQAFSGNGRAYRVAFTASYAGLSCQGAVSVMVPPTRGSAVTDDGQQYDATRR
ncbi:hypothetical protein BJL95_10575 [Methylomonas sp. LWB]|uniref:PKD domain-containing protein n=1 Tax=Methylomonas sp. LWB TaxID=1905845 RepID=UPI0008D9699C|nr:PKD domain-containing protein [Methylomonas sp. LWB]OHX36221.1 hypothetical protein BJL95_10575 [Methylomonas sp. LWB]